jgi:O-antigen/teichoic acid export membrane protein
MVFSLRKVGGNALSILTSDVLNRAASFVIYAMVARHLGAQEFGQLTLAFSLFYMFQIFAIAGLKVLIIREVAKDRSLTRLYFLNSCAILAVSSLVSVGALLVFLRLMHYSPSTNIVILLLSLGLFPAAISAVCEGIFQAWERMHCIAWVNVPMNLGKMTLAFLLLSRNHGLYAVVGVLLSAFLIVAMVETWLVLRRFPAPPAPLSLSFSLRTARSAVTFLGIDGTLAIEASIIALLLSKLGSVAQVGLFSAACQVMVPLNLVFQSMAQTIFPLMCQRVAPGLQNLKRIAVPAIELLLMLAMPVVAGVFFLGRWVLSLFYKNPAFHQAAPVLRIIAWVLLLQVFTQVLGQVLLATHREKVTLRIVMVCTIVNLLAGWPLIKFFGLRGAAITLVLNRLASSIQHYVPVSRLLSGIPLGKMIWKPAVAAACMATYLGLAATERSILAGISATLLYGVVLLVLGILACGSIREFKTRLFYTWSGATVRQEEIHS